MEGLSSRVMGGVGRLRSQVVPMDTKTWRPAAQTTTSADPMMQLLLRYMVPLAQLKRTSADDVGFSTPLLTTMVPIYSSRDGH
jgi:hypothetical protein